MQYWKKLSKAEISERIKIALDKNIYYNNTKCLGIPASKLDSEVFNDEAPFLTDAPLLQTFVSNPNHIGCHTLESSESFFAGTQALEKEVIETLAVDFLNATPIQTDGYIASGGTECNIQAIWMYRNLYKKIFNAKNEEICILCSEDTHYSSDKAADLLNIEIYKVKVAEDTRKIQSDALIATIEQAQANGKKYFIVIANMGTTMFGSIDDVDLYCEILDEKNIDYKVHVDAAFGGFIYPISMPNNHLSFGNEKISSITLDAHKMLQAPYGTGVFVCRKGLIQNVLTLSASYIHGLDMTLSGSRSGSNAVAVWMILYTYGPFGWLEKINKLLYRTHWLCQELDKINIPYFRQPKMNIVTIRAHFIKQKLAEEFGLVPDNHDKPNWYKVVVMDHVEIPQLKDFINTLHRELLSH